jgi:hypothetical protein
VCRFVFPRPCIYLLKYAQNSFFFTSPSSSKSFYIYVTQTVEYYEKEGLPIAIQSFYLEMRIQTETREQRSTCLTVINSEVTQGTPMCSSLLSVPYSVF